MFRGVKTLLDHKERIIILPKLIVDHLVVASYNIELQILPHQLNYTSSVTLLFYVRVKQKWSKLPRK